MTILMDISQSMNIFTDTLEKLLFYTMFILYQHALCGKSV